ncbi:uncharacterized [Tachysurus ichikawai]
MLRHSFISWPQDWTKSASHSTSTRKRAAKEEDEIKLVRSILSSATTPVALLLIFSELLTCRFFCTRGQRCFGVTGRSGAAAINVSATQDKRW